MKIYVINASVAAKWVLPDASEPLKQEATSFLNDWTDGKIRLIVPDLFWIELANILWKAIRSARTTRPAAEAGMKYLRQRKIPTFRSIRILDSAFEKAVTHDRSVYDSVYIALAVESKGVLITADQKLVNAVSTHFPIRWLGAI